MFDQAITWGTISSLSIVILRSKHCHTSPTCLPGGVEAPAAAAEAGHVGAHVGLGGVRAPLARAGEHPLRPQHCRDQYFGLCSNQKYFVFAKKNISTLPKNISTFPKNISTLQHRNILYVRINNYLFG